MSTFPLLLVLSSFWYISSWFLCIAPSLISLLTNLFESTIRTVDWLWLFFTISYQESSTALCIDLLNTIFFYKKTLYNKLVDCNQAMDRLLHRRFCAHCSLNKFCTDGTTLFQYFGIPNWPLFWTIETIAGPKFSSILVLYCVFNIFLLECTLHYHRWPCEGGELWSGGPCMHVHACVYYLLSCCIFQIGMMYLASFFLLETFRGSSLS
jgi:hypothetical protein